MYYLPVFRLTIANGNDVLCNRMKFFEILGFFYSELFGCKFISFKFIYFEVQKGRSHDESVFDPVCRLSVPSFHPNPFSALYPPLRLGETRIPLVPLPRVTHCLWKPVPP